jgi:hypothetical protein
MTFEVFGSKYFHHGLGWDVVSLVSGYQQSSKSLVKAM